MERLRQVLNAKAMRDEARRLTLLSIFGAEGDEDEEEEEDDSSDDSDSEDEEDDEDDDDDSDSDSKTFPKSYVKKLRQESAATRIARKEAEKRATELQKQLDEINEKDLSEKEKAEKRAEQAEEKAQKAQERVTKLLVSNRIEAVARDLTFNDPDDAHLLLDLSKLDKDEDGIPTSKAIKSSLKKLIADKPYLVKSTSGDGGAHGANPPTDATKKREEELVKQGRVRVG